MHRNSRLQSISDLYETAIERFDEARALILSAPPEAAPETAARVEALTCTGVDCVLRALKVGDEIQPLSPADQEDLKSIKAHVGQQASTAAMALQAAMYDHPRFAADCLTEITGSDSRFGLTKLRSPLQVSGHRPPFGTPVPPQPDPARLPSPSTTMNQPPLTQAVDAYASPDLSPLHIPAPTIPFEEVEAGIMKDNRYWAMRGTPTSRGAHVEIFIASLTEDDPDEGRTPGIDYVGGAWAAESGGEEGWESLDESNLEELQAMLWHEVPEGVTLPYGYTGEYTVRTLMGLPT